MTGLGCCCFCGEPAEARERVYAVTGSSTGDITRMWHAERQECVAAHGDWLAMREEVRDDA